MICAGARRPGGITENARVYLSPISTVTLMQRAHEMTFTGDRMLGKTGTAASGMDDEEEMGKRNG